MDQRTGVRRAAARSAIVAAALGWLAASPAPARADDAVIVIRESNFRAGAGRITFAEVPLRTRNPVLRPGQYGGDETSPTVQFGGLFQGRRIAAPAECPLGAARTGCLGGTPVAPLALDPGGPPALTVFDGSPGIRSEVLSGSPVFNGPIAVWFDRDIAAVGLQGGYFDARGGVAITVYDRQGRRLGQTVNTRIGVEFLGLATRDLSPRIAGLEFHLVGAEPHGFGIDNLRFGRPDQVEVAGVEPPRAVPERPLLLP
ncbi:PEP-CTERM sorting domain-containing protein [Elioraea sp.]|uniref:PEP-CTERM sorting domain-containing protein n=1 Tax=Elioraea sp. TaxID=2185103 RepID=UPI003F6FEC9A